MKKFLLVIYVFFKGFVLFGQCPLPTPTISGPQTVCQGTSATFTTASGYTNYIWTPFGGATILSGQGTNSVGINFSGNSGGTISVAYSNGICPQVQSAPYPISIIPSVSVSASSLVLCPGGSVTLTATAANSYSWSNGAATQSISVSSAGTYSVTVNNQNCVSSSSNIMLTSYPTPTISASGSTTFCQGGSVVLTASTGSVIYSGTTYLWSNGLTSQSVNVNTGGSYSVTVTYPGGCVATSQATQVTVNPVPQAVITGPSVFCSNQNYVLTANACAGCTYQWNPANSYSNTITVIPSIYTGSFTVTVTNAYGCSATSAPFIVTSTQAPAKPGFGDNCIGWIQSGSRYWGNQQSPVTFVAQSNCSNCDLKWSGPTNDPNYNSTTGYLECLTNKTSYTPFVSGSYFVTSIDKTSGCASSSSEEAIVYTKNPLNISGPQSPICSGASTNLSADGNSYCNLIIPSPSMSYTWSPSVGLSSTTGSLVTASPTSTTTYTVLATDQNGCIAGSNQMSVVVNPLPTAAITPSGSTAICQGSSVTLTASSGSSYLWSTGATAQSITVNTSGNYAVTITNANNCSATSASTIVTVNPSPAAPTITASGPLAFCAGGAVTLTSSAGNSYLWSTGATTPSITVSTAGSYTVRVTNAYGCQSPASAPTTVTINPSPATPTISASGATTFCAGGSVTLTSTASSSYRWSTGATTQSITVSSSGNYSVTVTNANGCSATSAQTAVTVNPAPSSNITVSSFCNYSVLSVPAASSYSWSTGATTQSITVSTDGNYTATVTNNGCSSTSTVGVTIANIAGKILASPSTNVCQAGYVYLTAPAGTSPSSYNWSTGGLTQTITVYDAGTYSVTVTSGVCTRTLSIKVTASSPNCVILLKTADEPSNADEPNVEAMTVYPNPASKFLTIALPSRVNEETSVQLFDMVGKGVATANIPTGAWKVQMPLEQVRPGMYVVKVGLGEHGAVRKVMVVE